MLLSFRLNANRLLRGTAEGAVKLLRKLRADVASPGPAETGLMVRIIWHRGAGLLAASQQVEPTASDPGQPPRYLRRQGPNLLA